jgi:hypothetical protein
MDSDISCGRARCATCAPKSLVSERLCAGMHRFNAFEKEENMLGMEQNQSLKGIAKWVYTVQRHTWSAITC